MGLHLHIDPFAGIAGDMFLGAMIDLGVPLERLQEALGQLKLDETFTLSAESVLRHGMGAVDFKVNIAPAAAQEQDKGHHAQHHSHGGHYRDILGLIDALDTTPRGKERARRVVEVLAQAEAQVHRKSVDEVHFHEVGAVDSIVDMLGAAVALEILDVDTLSSGPLPIGRGFVRCQHGRMPLPAPATACLMRGLATVGVDREVEMVTPTGAAIVAAWCDTTGTAPAMTLRGVGYGAGDRQDPDVPNLLRLFLGQRAATSFKPSSTAMPTTTTSPAADKTQPGHSHPPHSHPHPHPHRHTH